MKLGHLFNHSPFFSFTTLFMLKSVLWEVKAEGELSDDYKALSALYQATNGDNWTANTNWITNSDVCTWENVDCYDQSRVQSVILSDNNLSGSIPTEIGLLDQVNGFHLDYNLSLRGTIPTEIGLLSNNLQFLQISHNAMDGTIPSEVGKLLKLYLLDFYNTSIGGSIPSTIQNLISLQVLTLNWNSLSGTLPTELGLLRNLSNLALNDNELTGTVPTELGNNSNIVWMSLSNNLLTGSISAQHPVCTLIESNALDYISLDCLEISCECCDFCDGVTATPTRSPTAAPTVAPSRQPTTKSPTKAPVTSSPTKSPTTRPTKSPTKAPVTSSPTKSPTKAPVTSSPTKSPTTRPTKSPTKAPVTSSPTKLTTFRPTNSPTKAPGTSSPTKLPTPSPTKSISTPLPTTYSEKPIPSPTVQLSAIPTFAPTLTVPSFVPSEDLTTFLTKSPSKTQVPSISPETMVPTITNKTPPNTDPTASSSMLPSTPIKPSSFPTTAPSISSSAFPTISLPVTTNVSLPSFHETNYNNITRFMEYLRAYDEDLMNYLQNTTLSEAYSVAEDPTRGLTYSSFEIANVTSSLLNNEGTSCNTTALENQCYQIDTEVNVLHHPKLFTITSVKVMVTKDAIDFINVRGTFDGNIPIDVQAGIEVFVTGVQNAPMSSDVILLFEESIVNFLNQEIESDVVIDTATLLYQTLKEPQTTLEDEDPINVASSVLIAGVNITGAYIPPPELRFDEVIIDTFDEDNEIFVDILAGTEEIYFQNVSNATASFIMYDGNNESDKDQPFGELGIIGGSLIIAMSVLLCLSLALVALYRNKKRLDFIEGHDDHMFVPDDSTQNLQTKEVNMSKSVNESQRKEYEDGKNRIEIDKNLVNVTV